MNEQLQQTINEILTRSIEAFNQGADWMAGQIPDVVEQLLLWKFTISLVAFMAALLVLVFSSVILPKILSDIEKNAVEAYNNKEPWTRFGIYGQLTSNAFDARIGNGWIPYALSGISILFILFNLTWLKIWIAPKLYLLEYAAQLIN